MSEQQQRAVSDQRSNERIAALDHRVRELTGIVEQVAVLGRELALRLTSERSGR